MIFLLMAIWVVIYICCIYSKNDEYVYVNGIDRRGQQSKSKKKCDEVDHDRDHNHDHDYYDCEEK